MTVTPFTISMHRWAGPQPRGGEECVSVKNQSRPELLPVTSFLDVRYRIRQIREGPSLRRGAARQAAEAAGGVHRDARARLPGTLRRGAARKDGRAPRAPRERRVARRVAVR